MLDERDRTALLAIARGAIAAYVNRQPLPGAQAGSALDRPAGAFVTIHNHRELRGCIGHIEANRPLAQVVAECAVAVVAAATLPL